ncbi:hypothetical protein GCM10023191_017260 [Actinoallomurus oryzae]|uniref:Uncharacterized protein n=1 Tax=Actinoallomurus oryzae TaxID=502180 RepID=A0ABP8PM87_9ACTN
MGNTKNWIYIIFSPIIGIALLLFRDYVWAVIAFAAGAVLLAIELRRRARETPRRGQG